MSSRGGFTNLDLAEENVSETRLFDLFCNYLSLGQWELARLCLSSLRSSPNTHVQLRDILLGLLANPSEARSVQFQNLIWF